MAVVEQLPLAAEREEHPVHAVMITFVTSVDATELAEPFGRYAAALRDVPGLVAKTWVVDGSTVGGFHLFTSSAAAVAYVDGELFASERANPAFSRFDVAHFDVVEELSAVTNGLGGAMPAPA